MAAAATDVTATCDNDRDLPLTGSCAVTLSFSTTFASLATNTPLHWDSQTTGVPAAWMCSWQDNIGAVVHIPSGTATICCILNP
jgi:hypothetical protein